MKNWLKIASFSSNISQKDLRGLGPIETPITMKIFF